MKSSFQFLLKNRKQQKSEEEWKSKAKQLMRLWTNWLQQSFFGALKMKNHGK